VTFLIAPGLLLRAEAAALLVLATLAYARIGASWLAFVALLLAPDLGMLGYLRGTRLGAATYNLVHTDILPAALLAYGWLAGDSLLTGAALIWLAHIGMDRLLGFGLKYPTAFRDTHLQHL
jgi:hypothetical protein